MQVTRYDVGNLAERNLGITLAKNPLFQFVKTHLSQQDRGL